MFAGNPEKKKTKLTDGTKMKKKKTRPVIEKRTGKRNSNI